MCSLIPHLVNGSHTSWLSTKREFSSPGSCLWSERLRRVRVFYGLENVLWLLGVFMHGKREGQKGEINSDP